MDASHLQELQEDDAGDAASPCGERFRSPALSLAHALSLLVFPLILGIFWLTFFTDKTAYVWILKEDRLVELLTALCFAAAGLLSFAMVFRRRPFSWSRSWFFILFGLFCLICAMEEISWGQRVLGVKTPEFFMKHSDQREINVHNALEKSIGIRLRIVVGWVFGLYGALLPLLARFPGIARFFSRTGLRVPPLSLAPGFLAASLLVILDRPTGGEEELGEFLYGLCFFLFMFLEHLRLLARRAAAPPADSGPGPLFRRWSLYGVVGLFAALLAALLTIFSTEGFLKRPYRLSHYLASRAAARGIPPSGGLLVSSALLPLLGDRGDCVTWESYRPGEDDPRFIFESLTSGDRSRGNLLLGALDGGYGGRFFDGDAFVLEKGAPKAPPELRYVLEHWPATVFTAWTAGDVRKTRYIRGGGIVRYWKGGPPGPPVVVSYGKPRPLGPGRYSVNLRYRIDEGRPREDGVRGSLSLYRTDREETIASMDLEEAAAADAFQTVSLQFLLEGPAEVQPRVTGGSARLWLHWLVIEGLE